MDEPKWDPAPGKRLTEFRNRKGISLNQLARLYGMSPSNMSRLENAGAEFTMFHAERLGPLLDVEPLAFFGGMTVDEIEKEFLARVRGLSEEERKFIFRIAATPPAPPAPSIAPPDKKRPDRRRR